MTFGSATAFPAGACLLHLRRSVGRNVAEVPGRECRRQTEGWRHRRAALVHVVGKLPSRWNRGRKSHLPHGPIQGQRQQAFVHRSTLSSHPFSKVEFATIVIHSGRMETCARGGSLAGGIIRTAADSLLLFPLTGEARRPPQNLGWPQRLGQM